MCFSKLPKTTSRILVAKSKLSGPHYTEMSNNSAPEKPETHRLTILDKNALLIEEGKQFNEG